MWRVRESHGKSEGECGRECRERVGRVRESHGKSEGESVMREWGERDSQGKSEG